MTKYYLPIMMFRCLILTIIFELFLAIILGIRNKKDIINVILVNILTNPIVVSVSTYINLRYGILPRRISIIFLEAFAVIVEGLIYKKYLKYNKINGMLLSFILNIFSYSVGCIINYIEIL